MPVRRSSSISASSFSRVMVLGVGSGGGSYAACLSIARCDSRFAELVAQSHQRSLFLPNRPARPMDGPGMNVLHQLPQRLGCGVSSPVLENRVRPRRSTPSRHGIGGSGDWPEGRSFPRSRRRRCRLGPRSRFTTRWRWAETRPINSNASTSRRSARMVGVSGDATNRTSVANSMAMSACSPIPDAVSTITTGNSSVMMSSTIFTWSA